MTTPLRGRVTSPFGDRIHPITKVNTFHNGIDISAPIGADVRVPESGEVARVYDHETGGITVIMIADSGTRYGFAHLDKSLVKPGERVTEGHVIAKSGNTGKSTGPHLHFTVQQHGIWIDPATRFNFN